MKIKSADKVQRKSLYEERDFSNGDADSVESHLGKPALTKLDEFSKELR